LQLEGGTMNPVGNFSGGEVIGLGGVTSTISIKEDMAQQANFEKLEHIVIRVWIDHTRRGDVEVQLSSPGGVRSVLAEKRRSDDAPSGFPGWTFMTVKHWGEDIVGDWSLNVSDQASPDHNGTFLGWNMVFWGSVIDASKAVLYEVSHEDPVLPPYEEPQPLPPTTATNTKTHAKPTIFLPSDQGRTSTAAATPSASVKVEAEEGTVPPSLPAPSEDSQISIIIHALRAKLLTGIIVLLSIIVLVGLFLCRSAIRSKSAYMALPAGRNVPMSSRGPVGGGGGEESDDEADERTGLRGDSYQHLGFHSGFLDDEEHEYLPSAGQVSPSYRDETLASEALERRVSTSS